MSGVWKTCVDPRGRPAPPVVWSTVAPRRDRADLRRWRAAVGPVRVGGVGGSGGPGAGSAAGSHPRAEPGEACLTIVAWNVRVGGGSVHALWDHLTGPAGIAGRDSAVVLLLQEVFAGGPRLPAVGAGSAWASRIADRPPGEDRTDIVSFARLVGLHLVYVPSMRNGDPEDGGPPEDRGNAIVANVPLSSPRAIELPFERQRRVAVAATVAAGAVSVALCSVHLDNRAPWRRMWRSLGSSRRRQMTGLLAAFPGLEADDTADGSGAYVLGGDFNTWFRGRAEGCYRVARRSFPQPRHPDPAPTQHWELGGRLRLADHLLFRLPTGWRGEYRRLNDTFGSDHYPLVGTLEPGADPGARSVPARRRRAPLIASPSTLPGRDRRRSRRLRLPAPPGPARKPSAPPPTSVPATP